MDFQIDKYKRADTGQDITSGIIAVIQSYGSKINLHPFLHKPILSWLWQLRIEWNK